jgi:transcriptional regulator with XRE-family HTH domain
MKKYSDFKKRLLEEDQNFKKVYEKKDKLFRFLNSLIELRKEKRYSLKDLSEKTGIRSSNLSRIENGKQNISYEIMYKLSEALGGNLFLTAKGDNVVELSDGAMRKLKVIAKDQNLSQYLENIIDYYYAKNTSDEKFIFNNKEIGVLGNIKDEVGEEECLEEILS